MATIERIAVVGWEGESVSNGERKADFFRWDESTSRVNLKDYDVWVLLPDVLAEDPASGTLWTTLDVGYVHDAMQHHTDIYVIGDARRTVSRKGYGSFPFLYWSGLSLRWDSAVSTTEKLFENELAHFGIENYLKAQPRWDYALTSATSDGQSLGGSFLSRQATNFFCFDMDVKPLCMNRYGRSIAFALTLASYTKDQRSTGWELSSSFGSIVVLPQNSRELSNSLHAILAEAFELSVQETEPAWMIEVSAPGQSEIDSALIAARQERDQANVKIERLSTERDLLRKPLEALYQTGPQLELSVLSLLENLGATIERPTETNREDGWISVETSTGLLEGVLEIKGASKAQFDSYGIKQLLEWVNGGIQVRMKRYKPIFIGTSSPQVSPALREDPFPDSWKKQADLANVVALTTSTLYEAFCLHKMGQLDTDLFWISLFRKSGVFTAVELRTLPNSTQSDGSPSFQTNVR